MTTPTTPLVSNNKQLAASICAILIALVSLLGAYGVITPQQSTATQTMIQQLMQDMNLTYAQVTNALQVEVGSSLYGLAGPYSYMIAHPLGDDAVTAMKNGTTGAWDYWSSTNFATVVQTAINALPQQAGMTQSSGSILFKGGGSYPTFTTTTGLQVLTSGVTLYSDSGASIRFANSANQNSMITFGDGVSDIEDCKVIGLVLDGNGAQNTKGNGIIANYTGRLTIRDTTIANFKEAGFNNTAASYPNDGPLFDHDNIRANGYGIYNPIGNGITITNKCHIESNLNDGIYLANSEEHSISDSYSTNNYGCGLNLTAAVIQDSNNWYQDNTQYGININGGPGSNFVNDVILRNGWQGIRLQSGNIGITNLRVAQNCLNLAGAPESYLANIYVVALTLPCTILNIDGEGGLAGAGYDIWIRTNTVNPLIILGGQVNSTGSINFDMGSGFPRGIVRNVQGFNPMGKVAYPFGLAPTLQPIFGFGSSTTPSNNTLLQAWQVGYYITSTGGTGINGGTMNITVTDQLGNQIFTGATTLQGYYLPVEYQIEWVYATAPTAYCFGD